MTVLKGHRPDYFLLVVLILLTAGGLVILSSASSELGKIKFDDTYYYLKHQILYGLIFGALCFAAVYKIHYASLKKLALPFLAVNIILLILVFTKLGFSAGGASRWLQIGPATIQPAEFLKFTLIVYLAAWLSNPKSDRVGSFTNGLLPFLAILGITGGLIVLQPATSTVVILIAACLTIYFISGAKWRYIALTVLLMILVLAALVYVTPYRLNRVVGFLNPQDDSQSLNYHRNQAEMAIGSGRLFGLGYGQSPAKVNYLPEVVGDSIFAVAAQELGFAGSASLIVLFGMLVFRLFWLAKKTRDRFSRLILIGFGTIIAVQSLMNMAAISGIIPLTGVPLPFISYGGTALAVFLAMAGLSLNISKYA